MESLVCRFCFNKIELDEAPQTKASESPILIVKQSFLMDQHQRVDVEDVVKDKIDKIVATRSSDFYSDFEKTYIVDAFPELFPFGRGGLDEDRDKPWSLEKQVRHLLDLSSRTFSKHYSFMLVMMDIISRHRGIRSVYLRTTRAPVLSISALKVQRESLEIQMTYRKAVMDNLRANRPPPDKPEFDQDVFNLMCGVRSGQGAMFGTGDERLAARTKAFSMQAQLGAVSIFFTQCADSFGTMKIRRMNAETRSIYNLEDAADVVTDEQLAELNRILTVQEMTAEAVSDGYTSAKYASFIINTQIF
jgi:hypothetical protein